MTNVLPAAQRTRRARFCAWSAVLLYLSGSAIAADQFEPIRHSIEQHLIERRVPSVAVAVAKGDRILWEAGFGWADREGRIPATAHTMYSLASISKPLTATALMTLVKAGKISLDKPINDYLGSAKLDARIGDANEATVRRVANHSSGLPEHYQFFYENEPWHRPSIDETILRYGLLMTPPGEHYQYSNLGYGILSSVISRISGRAFADYMREEVFLPLGMTHSSVGVEPSLSAYVAVRYGRDGLPIPQYETTHDGASAIYASAHDLIRFGMFHLKAHLSDQTAILSDEMIDAMHAPTVSEGDDKGYGVGWETRPVSGYLLLMHDGDMPGVRTELRLVPSERLVVVVLCNAEDRLAPIVADEIMQAMLRKWKSPNASASIPRPAFVPPPELIGVWKGDISTFASKIPITVRVRDSGDVQVEMADQLSSLLNFARFTPDGFLRGITTGDLGIEDAARRPYVLGLNLKLRNGHVLNGAVTARADESGVIPTYGLYPRVSGQPAPERVQARAFVLAQWAELTKQ
jgi:CubicO group peptidase (beta-lactamase class C family)